MSIFRDVEIEWKGEAYVFTPSNRLLRRIEGEGISFPRLVDGVASGAPAVAEVCFVVSEFLREAGAKDVDEDEIYNTAMTALAEGDSEAFLKLANVVVEAIAPKGLEQKGRDGKKKKDRKPRSSSGKSQKG